MGAAPNKPAPASTAGHLKSVLPFWLCLSHGVTRGRATPSMDEPSIHPRERREAQELLWALEESTCSTIPASLQRPFPSQAPLPCSCH